MPANRRSSHALIGRLQLLRALRSFAALIVASTLFAVLSIHLTQISRSRDVLSGQSRHHDAARRRTNAHPHKGSKPCGHRTSGDIKGHRRVRHTQCHAAPASEAGRPVNTGAPVISGDPIVGSTIKSTTGAWKHSPRRYTYHWRHCTPTGVECRDIPGATGERYVIARADEMHTIDVLVTASNKAGSAPAQSRALAVRTSVSYSPPLDDGPPTISGTPMVGSTLAAATGTWSNNPTAFDYQWESCGPSGTPCTPIAGATSSTYTPASTDVGAELSVSVAAVNAGGAANAVSQPTTPVTEPDGGASIYVGETATGKGDGSDCANSESAAWFNDPSDWGSAAGLIGPGTVVGLCGIITTPLAAHGSGTAGSPITVYWEYGAALSEPFCPGANSGCFNTNRQSYLTLDGGPDGVIRSTANGTTLANRQSSVVGIYAIDCTGCTIENLTIANMYVHSSPTDTSIDQTENNAIEFSGSGMRILNNVIHDVGWALYDNENPTDVNVRVQGNDIYNTDHGLALVANNFVGGEVGPVVVDGNDFHDYANWDTETGVYHHDGIHCYTSDNGQGAAHYTGLYIYDNLFGGLTDLAGEPDGDETTAQIFLEGGTGPSATPCADSSSEIYIFNNVASVSSDVYNGVFGIFSGQAHVYNNTLIGSDTTGGLVFGTGSDVTKEALTNNVLTSGNQLLSISSPSYLASGSPSHNVYANGGTNAFVCGQNYYPFSGFSKWVTCIGGDAGSAAVASAGLTADGAPAAKSAAMGVGENLTSLCTNYLAALCNEMNGTPRPASGPWDAGAY